MLVEQPASNQLALHLAKLLTYLTSLGSILTPLLKLVLGELPVTKFAAEIRARPSWVLAPVLAPPCSLQRPFFLLAGH